MPLKSIGFVGSYGRGPGTVVGVAAEVVGVGAEVAGVGAEGADVVPPNGANGAGRCPSAFEVAAVVPGDGAAARRLAFFAFRIVVDDRVERLNEVVDDESSDECVARGAALSRVPPLEHAAANISNATAPQAGMLLLLGVVMPAAYGDPAHGEAAARSPGLECVLSPFAAIRGDPPDSRCAGCCLRVSSSQRWAAACRKPARWTVITRQFSAVLRAVGSGRGWSGCPADAR